MSGSEVVRCSWKFTGPDGKVERCGKRATCPICGCCCDDPANPGIGYHCPGHKGLLDHIMPPKAEITQAGEVRLVERQAPREPFSAVAKVQ